MCKLDVKVRILMPILTIILNVTLT